LTFVTIIKCSISLDLLEFYSYKNSFEGKRRILKRKEKKKRRIKVGKKILSAFMTFMSIKNTTFKYEEYEMAIDGAHNDVLVAINDNEEVEIIECEVRI